MSWIDCASTGKNFARGIFMLGDHSQVPGELKPSPEPKLVFPFEAPGFALNHTTVSLFNTVFFHKQMKARVKALQDYEPFFYPLDAVLHWNRMYGKRGLLQFQYAIPWESCARRDDRDFAGGGEVRAGELSGGAEGVWRCAVAGVDELSAAGDYAGAGLSRSGRSTTFPLFERLADMTREFGGRLYPAKDAAMTAAQFQAFYPQWEQFARYKDPVLTSSFWERVHRRSTRPMSTQRR